MPVFETITYSTHAEWRMRKRGFSHHDVELVLRIGMDTCRKTGRGYTN